MGRPTSISRLASLAAVAVFLSQRAASADDSTDLATARSLAIEGLRLASAHKCEEAIDRLTRAERIHHAPTTLGRLAECQIELGQLVAATENLRRLLHEPLPPRPPPAFVFARTRAERTLAATLPKIAALTITVQPANARVLLDGAVVAPSRLGVGQPSDPGEHSLEVTAPGFVRVETKVTLQRGETREMAFDLAREAAPSEPGDARERAAPPAAPTVALGPPPPPPPAHVSSAGTWTAFGIGVAGVGAGLVLGGLYFSARSDFESRCPGGTCPAGANVSDEEVTTYRAASAGALVLGVTSIAVGVVLLVTGGGQPLSSAGAGAPRARF